MRALVVGLAAVMLAGAAQAKSCNLNGAELKADDGRTFRVLRLSSHFDRIKSPKVNDWKSDGYVLAVIEGDGQKFVISQTYSGWGMPNNAAYSYGFREARAADIGSKRALKAERARVDGTFDILDGPLEGISLRPLRCG